MRKKTFNRIWGIREKSERINESEHHQCWVCIHFLCNICALFFFSSSFPILFIYLFLIMHLLFTCNSKTVWLSFFDGTQKRKNSSNYNESRLELSSFRIFAKKGKGIISNFLKQLCGMKMVKFKSLSHENLIQLAFNNCIQIIASH